MDHFYQSIPGFFQSEECYKVAVKDAPEVAHFVEVGSYKGRSSSYMAVEILNSGKKIKFDCVDTWLGNDEFIFNMDQDVINGTLFESFEANMLPVRGIYKPIRKLSRIAAMSYADCSLNFVFLDASQDYVHVRNDIIAWWPKIKEGGWLAGEYTRGSVRAAVHDLLYKKPFHTNYLSWIVVKENNDPLKID